MTFNLTYPAGMVPLLTDAGVGLLRRREEGGDGRDIQLRTRSAGTTNSTTPLWVYKADAAKISIVPGVVDNIGPTLNGVALTVIPRPMSNTLGNGIHKVYLDIACDGSGIATGVTVETTSGSLPTETPTQSILHLATVTVSGGIITNIDPERFGSHWHHRCGGTVHLFGLSSS